MTLLTHKAEHQLALPVDISLPDFEATQGNPTQARKQSRPRAKVIPPLSPGENQRSFDFVEDDFTSALELYWDEDLIKELHEATLFGSLKQLFNPRSNKALRIDVLMWIERETIKPRENPKPLSFEACCRIAGYDAEELLETVHRDLVTLGLHPTKCIK